MVPETGIEPARPCGHMTLNHARLPVPPFGQYLCANVGKILFSFHEKHNRFSGLNAVKWHYIV